MIIDSRKRHLQATGWLLGAIMPMLLLLPSFIFTFAASARDSFHGMRDIFFLLGLIGGIVPLVVGLGYFVTYQGVAATPPDPTSPPLAQPLPGQMARTVPLPTSNREQPVPPPARPDRPRAKAWLVDEKSNNSFQLFQGDTRAGRGKNNDIPFMDKAVSREHILIREENGQFTLYDRGLTGTRVNGKRIDSPVLLTHGDAVELGDTRLRFVIS